MLTTAQTTQLLQLTQRRVLERLHGHMLLLNFFQPIQNAHILRRIHRQRHLKHTRQGIDKHAYSLLNLRQMRGTPGHGSAKNHR